MKIDLLKYNKMEIMARNVMQSNKDKSHCEIISCIAVASHAPAIVASYYYVKNLGYFPEEVKKQIISLKSFYGYDEIIGVDELLKGIDYD